jgi:hypothetical protein
MLIASTTPPVASRMAFFAKALMPGRAMFAADHAHAADPDALQAAKALLELTGVETALDQSMERR